MPQAQVHQVTAPCVVCGGTDFSQPRGFYRQPGASWEEGPDRTKGCIIGPLHFDCADQWQAQQTHRQKRMRHGTEQARNLEGQKETVKRQPKSVTSKPHKRNVKR